MRKGCMKKCTEKALKLAKTNKGRVDGPTAMEIKDTMRLGKGKYKGTR